jgi:hypothetical protein
MNHLPFTLVLKCHLGSHFGSVLSGSDWNAYVIPKIWWIIWCGELIIAISSILRHGLGPWSGNPRWQIW